jgi:hypothetical protein
VDQHIGIQLISVAVPHHFDAHPDEDPHPAYHFYADTDADPEPIFQFDADPDPQHCN